MSYFKQIQVNPLVVIFLNLLIPAVYMIKVSQYNHFMFLGFALFILIMHGRYVRIVKFAVAYGLFHLVYLLPADSMLFAFLISWAVVMINFMPCVMLGSVLVYDYHSTQILSALNMLRLPKSFIIALTISLRYLPTFKSEFKFMKESLRLRGISYSWKNPIKSFEYFVVPQLFRCLILAEEITASGMVKGFDAPIRRTSYHDVRFRGFDFFLCALFLIAAAGGFLWVK